jgi:chromosome segregation ATPase
MEEETALGRNENDDLKGEINDYRTDLGHREGSLNNDLRPRARALESELAECEERSENQIRELQRLKNSFNEQLNKNANLCDDTNQLENELQSVRQLFKTLGQNRT